jgi:hypothetical protein
VQPASCRWDELGTFRIAREGFEWHDEAVAVLADDVNALPVGTDTRDRAPTDLAGLPANGR